MSTELSEIEIQRRNSLEKLRSLGLEPYPAQLYPVDSLSSEIKENYKEGKAVCIAGRIMRKKVQGKASFGEIQDSEGRIQVYFNRDEQEINFKEITKVQNNERTDVFYRECEYRVAGFHAGFDYQSSRILKPAEEKKVSFFNKTIPENIDKPNNLIIYAQKPKNNTNKRPITNWE